MKTSCAGIAFGTPPEFLPKTQLGKTRFALYNLERIQNEPDFETRARILRSEHIGNADGLDPLRCLESSLAATRHGRLGDVARVVRLKIEADLAPESKSTSDDEGESNALRKLTPVRTLSLRPILRVKNFFSKASIDF